MSKFVNEISLKSPLRQIFAATCRYDKEWKTNFLFLHCTEEHPKEPDRKAITDEVTICLNSKKEAEAFLKVIKKALRKMK